MVIMANQKKQKKLNVSILKRVLTHLKEKSVQKFMFSVSKLKKLCSMSHWVEEHLNQTHHQVRVPMMKNQWKSRKKRTLTQQQSKVGDMEMAQSRPRKIRKNLQNLPFLQELGMFHFSLEKRIYSRLDMFSNWYFVSAIWLVGTIRAPPCWYQLVNQS